MFIGFVVLVVVARWYGREATGLVAVINSSALVFGTVAAFGQGTYLIRELSASDPDRDHARKRQLYRASLSLSLLLSTFLLVPTIALLLGHMPDVNVGFSSPLIGIMAIALLGRTFELLTVNTSRALAPAPIYATFLILPGLVNLTIVLLGTVMQDPTALIPSFALAMGTMLTAGIAVLYNFRRLRNGSGQAGVDGIPSKQRLLRAGLPFLFANAFSILLLEGNIVLASFLLPISDVGVYSVACKVAALAVFVLTSISLVAQPRFARLRGSGDRDGLRRYARQVSDLVFWASVPIIVLFILVRHWLVENAFGPEFGAAADLIAILLAGRAVAALTGATDPYLTMTGGQKLLATIIAVAAVLGATLTLILTPIFGMQGAAIALSTSLVFWNLSVLVAIRLRDGFWLCWLPPFLASRTDITSDETRSASEEAR